MGEPKSLPVVVNTIFALDIVVDDDPIRNVKIHEIARAFVGGKNRTEAYLVAYPTSTKRNAQKPASRLFKEPFMVDLVRRYYLGESAEEAPLTREGAIKIWTKMVETNVLDYMAEEGGMLTVKELKSLDPYIQRAIKKIDVTTEEHEMVDSAGVVILGDNGEPLMVQKQRVKIELVDKQRALFDLARAEKWIESHDITLQTPISAEILIEAAMRRAETLRGKPIIEGTVEQLHDQKDD